MPQFTVGTEQQQSSFLTAVQEESLGVVDIVVSCLSLVTLSSVRL